MRRRVEEHIRPDHADRELKLGPRRAARRRVRGAAAAARARPHRRRRCARRPRSTRWPRCPTAATSAARTVRTSPPPTGSCGCSSTGCSCSACAAPTCCPPPTTRRRCAGWPARPGCGPTAAATSSACCLAEWTRNARRVRRLHEKLFYRPLLGRGVPAVAPTPCGCPSRRRPARLGALGWASPEGALRHLRALTSGVSRAASIQQTLLPVLLDELARSPDPDRGLLAYRRVSEALATTPWYLRLLRDEGLVAAAADAAARHLRAGAGPAGAGAGGAAAARRPGRRSGRRARPRDPAEVAASLRATVARQQRSGAAAATARSLRRHEMLRVACADLLGPARPPTRCARR